MIEIDCDDDDFHSGSNQSIWEYEWAGIEQQLYAQMMGWA